MHDIKSTSTKCDFCTASLTKGTGLFKSLYGVDQVISVPGIPENFLVMQDLVPLGLEGAHLLLVPNTEHLISFARIENQDSLEIAILNTIIFLRKYFGGQPICLFEHGPGEIDGQSVACGGCHLDHAHLHFVILPEGKRLGELTAAMERQLTGAGWNNILASRIELTSIVPPADLLGINPYLLIGLLRDDHFSGVCFKQMAITEQVESQLFRKVLATTIFNRPEPAWWHWRDISSGLSSKERFNEIKDNIFSFRSKTGT